MKIAAIHHYPVKSLGGEALERARVESRGIAGDRRWMLVDANGRFLTRRELPAMARIAAIPTPTGIRLRAAATADCDVPFPVSDGKADGVDVTVWRDRVRALPAGAAASSWLSALLGREAHLVHQPDDSIRPVDPGHARPGDIVGFADGFPLLVTTMESLAALNDRLERPVEMLRFRPNIVLSGAPAPWAEDGWSGLRVGALSLRIAKPCTRCIITTQDPETGVRTDGNEPLDTLRALGRRAAGGIIFGQNAIPDGEGEIAVGDRAEFF